MKIHRGPVSFSWDTFAPHHVRVEEPGRPVNLLLVGWHGRLTQDEVERVIDRYMEEHGPASPRLRAPGSGNRLFPYLGAAWAGVDSTPAPGRDGLLATLRRLLRRGDAATGVVIGLAVTAVLGAVVWLSLRLWGWRGPLVPLAVLVLVLAVLRITRER